MKTIRNYMKDEKTIFTIITVIAFCIVFSGNICSSIRSYRYRRLCSEYREQLIATEETNRELTDRIGRVAEITGRIKETTDANITDARDIIETVEILRSQIKELEDYFGSFNYNDYYEHWDSYYRNEGLMD